MFYQNMTILQNTSPCHYTFHSHFVQHPTLNRKGLSHSMLGKMWVEWVIGDIFCNSVKKNYSTFLICKKSHSLEKRVGLSSKPSLDEKCFWWTYCFNEDDIKTWHCESIVTYIWYSRFYAYEGILVEKPIFANKI